MHATISGSKEIKIKPPPPALDPQSKLAISESN